MALLLYDFCNYLYLELRDCWVNIASHNGMYEYYADEEMIFFPVSDGDRSCPNIPSSILDGEEEVVWKQPKFAPCSPPPSPVSTDHSASDSWESWDDFVRIKDFEKGN